MMQREPDKYGYATLDHVINPKRVMHWYNELIYWPRALWEIFMQGFVTLKRTLVTG